MTSTQEYLFDNKDKMPEEVYIQLMNNLKKDFEKKRNNERRYAKLTIVKIDPLTSSRYDDDEERWKHSTIQVRTKVVKIVKVFGESDDDGFDPFGCEIISKPRYKHLMECIEEQGYYDYSTRFETYIIAQIEMIPL